MTQTHMERLSPMDVSFLDQEKRGSHMHIGAVMTFEGPPPSHEDLRAHIESRLHLVPRYRQKLAYPRLEMGRPLWVDDPRFNLDYHVRHTALPRPGSEEQLRMLTGRIFSQRLDRSKPLWELWLVQGLEDNRFARDQQDPPLPRRRRLRRRHHDRAVRHVADADARSAAEPWTARAGALRRDAGREGRRGGRAGSRCALARRALHAARHPTETFDELREAAEGLGNIAWKFVNPPPPDAAQRADRPAPAGALDPHAARPT